MMRFAMHAFAHCKYMLFNNGFVEDEEQFVTGLMAILTGLIVPSILNGLTGMLVGEAAVEYYAEVHQMPLNKYIHTLFMPAATSGALLLIPAVFKMDKYDANLCQTSLYLMYMSHYTSMNLWIGLRIAFVYYFALRYAKMYYIHYESARKKGLPIVLGALFIQEIIGHYLSGDPASRLEGIPNAILYAVHFSVSH